MQLCHRFSRSSAVFDEPSLVSSAGLVPVVGLAERAGLRDLAGTRLTLHAIPAKGWKFARWGGACIGTRLTCTPKTDYALAARANFTKKR
jgi:hypothetical protein